MFGETLRRLREAAGLTQAALAARSGLSLRTIQSWEQDRRAPVSPDFFKLVNALGVDCGAFAEAAPVPSDEPAPARAAKGGAARKGPAKGKPKGGKGKS